MPSPRTCPRGARRWRAVVVPAAVVVAWAVTSHLRLVNPNLLPPPRAVLETAAEELGSSTFWLGVAASLARTASGFVLAALLGGTLGVALGVSRWADRLVGPTFHAYRQVAVFAWIPLLSAWFGGGEATKVAFITVAAATPVVLNTMEGVSAVAVEHVELARVLHLGPRHLVAGIIIPTATPQILTGLQLSLVTAWLATFGSEFFLQISPGVARILIEGRALARMDLVLVGVAVIGLIGFGLNSAMSAVERRLLHWRPAPPSVA